MRRRIRADLIVMGCLRRQRSAYGQVEDTIVTVSTLSFGAFAFGDADVVEVEAVDLEVLEAGSTVPATVTL